MTGFGNAQITENDRKLSVEIRSVNNKYLDLSVRLPREHSGFENRIRDLVRKHVIRGKISISLNLEQNFSEETEVQLDVIRIKKRYQILNQINTELGLKEPVTLKHLLTFPDISQNVLTENDEETIWPLINKGVETALGNFTVMREAEGRNIQKDLEVRLQLIADLTASVRERGKLNIRLEFDRLYQNVLLLIGEQKLDRNRLEQEIALISDRVDITEECVRMESHLDLLKKTLSGSEDVGKKITFILQEMLREANTMNSKTTDIEVSHKVIRIKEEIERLREQAQNVE